MLKKIKINLDFVSNPDKLLFEKLKIKKKMLIEYYASIQDWILPHLVNRPLTIVRCPDGVLKPCFYQKHPNETIPKSIRHMDFKSGDKIESYLYIRNLDGLLSLIELGALELHIWNSTINSPDHPDQLVLDLDPGDKFSFTQIVEGAFRLHEFFDNLHMKNFVKTTGKRGLNVVVPLAKKSSKVKVFSFAHAIAQLMSEKYPKLFVANIRKEERKNKIFIDYIRNAHGATFVAPYSTRATKIAGIATPLTWQELSKIKSGDFYDFFNLPKRLAKLKTDPWHDFFKIKQEIPKKLKII